MTSLRQAAESVVERWGDPEWNTELPLTHYIMALREVLKYPQQEPVGWMIEGSSSVLKGPYAELDAKAEAARCGGTCFAFPIYLRGN